MVSLELQKSIKEGKVEGGVPDKKNERRAHSRYPEIDENVD